MLDSRISRISNPFFSGSIPSAYCLAQAIHSCALSLSPGSSELLSNTARARRCIRASFCKDAIARPPHETRVDSPLPFLGASSWSSRSRFSSSQRRCHSSPSGLCALRTSANWNVPMTISPSNDSRRCSFPSCQARLG